MNTENTLTTNVNAALSGDTPKVTISFKTRPIMKIRYTREAEERGLTLSEWVESICSSFDATRTQNENVEELKKKLAFYESEALMKLFAAEKGEVVEFVNSQGCLTKLKIETPQDVYTAIIHSFKTDKP